MGASTWISPCSVSDCSPGSPAVMLWSRAVTAPATALGVPPLPRALPMATIDWPTASEPAPPVVTVPSPDAPWSWTRATSSVTEYPTTVPV